MIRLHRAFISGKAGFLLLSSWFRRDPALGSNEKTKKEALRSHLSPETEILVWGCWPETLRARDLGLKREQLGGSVMRDASALLDL